MLEKIHLGYGPDERDRQDKGAVTDILYILLILSDLRS
jgi:hypothetical protein